METLLSSAQLNWGPAIYLSLYYDYRRSGADMQYRFYYKFWVESSGYYQNNLRMRFYLNGSNVYSRDCKSYNSGWSYEYTTDWYTVSNKTSGTTPFYVTINDTQNDQWLQYNSGTWELYVAPAYTSISKFNVSKISGYNGLTQVKVDWATANTCDYIWYSTNNGSDWTSKYVNSSSGSFNISGLSPGTSYNFKLRVRRSDSQLTTDSGSVTQSTYAINTISSDVPDVSNGDSLSVTAANPSGASCRIRLETIINGETVTRFTKTGTSATFTVEELNSLLEYCTTSSTFTIRIVADTMNCDVVGYKSWKDATYKIIGSEPVFTNFAFQDISSVTDITGDNQVLVKNKSVLKVIISADNKMVTKNSATPNRYDINCANRSATVNYADTEVSAELGTISNTGVISCNVKAVDSRNLTTLVSKQIEVVDYFTPTMIYSIGRVNNFENNTLIKLNGSFAKVVVDNKIKNTVLSAKVRYKVADDTSDYGSWQNITFSVNSENGTYSCTDKTILLDNTETYFVQIAIQDKFEEAIETVKIAEGIPIMFISSTYKNVGIGLQNNNEEYSLQVSGNYYFNSGNKMLDYDIVEDSEVSKTFKYKDNNYVDSSGVLHNNVTLNTIIQDSVIGHVLYNETDFDNMKGNLSTLDIDVSQYKYLDVYYCSFGFTGGNVNGGNAINDTLRIDLTQPSVNPTLLHGSIDWRYGNSRWYPDAQYFIGETGDPGFFVEAAFVNKDKNKILIGKQGYYIISSASIQMMYTGDKYFKVCKIIGYK